MFFRPLLMMLLAAIALAPAGCRCPSCKCVPASNFAPCSYERACGIAETPDFTTLATVESDQLFLFPGRLPSPSDQNRVIDAATCQCNAARNARVAYLLKLEQHWAGVLIECESEPVRKALCLTRDLLKLREAEIRNEAAGSALTTLYTLAGVELQLNYVQLGIDEVSGSMRRYDELKQRGLALPDEVDRSQITTTLTDLQDQQLQLQLARIQLNGQLMRLLGCPLQSSDPFSPRVNWACDLTPPDPEVVAAEGMAHRADVRGVRLAVCRLERATMPVARAVLKLADGALGSVEPQDGICHLLRCGACYDAEEPIRRRQLCTMLQGSRQTALAKIKGAAFQVGIQQQRVGVARQAVLDRRKELSELERLRDLEDRSVFEISLARGRLFTAEATLVSMVVELKVSEVALKQEQGLLVVECGLGARLCCEPPATYTLPPAPPAAADCDTGGLLIPTAG